MLKNNIINGLKNYSSLVKILLIEDNPGDARLIEEMLKEAGIQFKLDFAGNLSTGIERIESDDFDVILLDLGLSDSQGLDTLKKLISTVHHAAVIVLTGIADYDTGIEAVKEGAQDYLIKGQINNKILARSIHYSVERKHGEEALQESEQKYRKLVELTSTGFLILDHRGIVIDANKEYIRMTGHKNLSQIVGRRVIEWTADNEAEKTNRAIEDCIRVGYVNNLEINYIDGQGRITPIEINSFVEGKGENLRIISLCRDITERKKKEELQIENLRLAAADVAKSEFLANMSHELRTPLHASIGFSELLNMGIAGELNEKQKHYVENILTSNQFLLTLINDILDLSKIEAGKIDLVYQKMSVPDTIKDTLSLIKEKAMKHNVVLKTEFEPELEFIEADRQRFKQILFNLLSNAVKFSKEKGGIVTITAKKEGGMAVIAVSDTGIGIKEENIARLFHKFDQLESMISQKYGGTGLGLSITKKLVELHGGRIMAQSIYGIGSTFTFTLPLVGKTGDSVNRIEPGRQNNG